MNDRFAAIPVGKVLPSHPMAHEDRALNAHLARQDKFAELGEMDYADLFDMEEKLSVSGDWSLLDDVRHEMNMRKASGMGALTRVFADAVKTNGAIPWVEFTGAGKKLGTRDVSWWLTEWAGTQDATAKCVGLVLDPSSRSRLIAALAAEYAKEEADELLCVGWTE